MTEIMQVLILWCITTKVLAYVQSLTAAPEYVYKTVWAQPLDAKIINSVELVVVNTPFQTGYIPTMT